MSEQSPLGRVVELVSKETGLPVESDQPPALVRIGMGWEAYDFDWSPFLRLADSLAYREDGTVVLISEKGGHPRPEVSRHEEPAPHTRIRIAPDTELPLLVDAWIGVVAETAEAPAESGAFLEELGLDPSTLSPSVLAFLGLDPGEGGTIDYSRSVRRVASALEGRDVAAVEIARELQRIHGEYAAGALGRAELAVPEDAPTHPWERWRDSVGRLYDAEALARSHQVVDGRLFLVGLGLVDPPLRAMLAREGAWVPLLLEVDGGAAPPGTAVREAIDGVQLESGFTSDATAGEDQLGIDGDVNAVCEVITDPDIGPPLAVGLFGSWGAGKSFFMEKMRERVQARGPRRLVGGRPQNVVQIRFNAWHYADSSLWASLAVEIFERLVDPEPVDPEDREEWLRRRGDPNRARREELFESLETYRTARSALALELSQLHDERERLARTRKEAERERIERAGASVHAEVLAEVLKDQAVRARLRSVAEAAGWDEVDQGTAEVRRQVEALHAELTTAHGYLARVWTSLRHPRRTMVLLGAAVVLAVGALAAGSLAPDAFTEWEWVGRVTSAFLAVASAAAATVRGLLPAVAKVNGILARAKDAVETAEKAERRAEQAALRRVDAELENASERIRETTSAMADVDRRIARTRAEARALSVGRSLYDFLADRAAGYRQHQGVVGMLHRDFRLLDAQLRAHSASGNGSGGDADEGLPRIDRVVLYVDDLDRCPPAKVLEVLEAVHLLLALPLFIVVVGVDPQWLQRSLRHQYRTLGETGYDDDAYLQAMPAEYLEKIFQIPLTLPAMGDSGYARLIASLAPGVDVQGGTPRPSGPRRRVAERREAGGEYVPTRSLLPVQLGSAADESGSTGLPLTPDEVGFAQRLGALVGTPRAAKRLMNTYRLVRATQNFGTPRFLGRHETPGECQAVMTLLAVAAGFPSLADRFFVALERDALADSPAGDWPTFIDSLRPGDGDRPAGGRVPGDLFPDPSTIPDTPAASEWCNLVDALHAATGQNSLSEMEPYHRWGGTVSRFSFTL